MDKGVAKLLIIAFTVCFIVLALAFTSECFNVKAKYKDFEVEIDSKKDESTLSKLNPPVK